MRLARSYLVIPLICLLYFASLGGIIQNINVVRGVQGHENIIFSDDFESYPIGSFPSQGGWEIVWDGAGREYQKVVIAREVLGFDEGHGRVLYLLGRTGWSSVVKKRFNTNSRYIGYEFDILILDRGGGYEDHPGFFCAECKTWGVYWATVKFNHRDGKIYAKDGTVLGSWTPGRWYHVKVILDRENDRYDVYIDGRLRGRDLPAKKSDEPSSWRINSLALVSGWPGKPVLYDNVKVFTVEAGSTSTTTTTTRTTGLEVDVYTDKGGRGHNVPDGTYYVGERVTIYCSVSSAVDELTVDLYMPSGEKLIFYQGSWAGRVFQASGTAGYPLGERRVVCQARRGNNLVSDETTFTVEEKHEEDAKIIDFDPPGGTYSPGDTLSASVTVKNTGNVERSFWVGLSYRRPNGGYYDVPPKRTRTLSPNEEQRLTFLWSLPADAPTGSYDAITAVWNGYDPQRNEMIPPQFDRKEVEDAFTVTSGPSVEVRLIQPEDGAVIRELPITFIVRVLVNGRPAEGVAVVLTCTDGGTSFCHPIDGKNYHFTDPDGYVRVQVFESLASGSCVRWYAEALYQGGTYRSAETRRFCYRPGGEDQYEPDNSMEQAKEIRSGENQRRSIFPAGDVDWAKFTLTERSEVVIETSGPSGDTVIYLYDSDGNLIAEDDDSGDAYWSRIEETLDPGTYYIKVVEYGENDEIPEYHLKLSVTPKPAGAILQIGIRHSYIGDLRIWVGVKREGEKKEKLVWDREGGSRENIFKEWDLFELGFAQDDLPPSENKRWYLRVRDEARYDEGRIEYFRIVYQGKIYESQDHPKIRDNQEVIAWIPSGERPPQDDAEIIEFTPPTGTYSLESVLIAHVTIENTGTTTRSFWIGLSYRRPDGNYYDVPPQQTDTLSPGERQTITFIWFIPDDAPEGLYDAITAIWDGYDPNRNRMIEPKYDVKEITDVFKIVREVTLIYRFLFNPWVSTEGEIIGYFGVTGNDEMKVGESYEITIFLETFSGLKTGTDYYIIGALRDKPGTITIILPEELDWEFDPERDIDYPGVSWQATALDWLSRYIHWGLRTLITLIAEALGGPCVSVAAGFTTFVVGHIFETHPEEQQYDVTMDEGIVETNRDPSKVDHITVIWNDQGNTQGPIKIRIKVKPSQYAAGKEFQISVMADFWIGGWQRDLHYLLVLNSEPIKVSG